MNVVFNVIFKIYIMLILVSSIGEVSKSDSKYKYSLLFKFFIKNIKFNY